jgi:DNA-directed RNA polymerase subunit M/transcription elongation factor TFIIS
MYYIRINAEDPNKLVYYCRKCGNEDKLLAIENVCVSKTHVKKTEQTFSHIINEYTKLDPTLPRITNVLCPNIDCSKYKDCTHRDIIYIMYDDSNMKFIYLCSTCNQVWQTNESA